MKIRLLVEECVALGSENVRDLGILPQELKGKIDGSLESVRSMSLHDRYKLLRFRITEAAQTVRSLGNIPPKATKGAVHHK